MFPVTKIVKHIPVVRLVDAKFWKTILPLAVFFGLLSYAAGIYADHLGVVLLSSAS